MSNRLTQFLTSIGAELTTEFGCRFGNNQHEPGAADTIITALPYYGLLTIEGPDTATFLQGQTTCNINDISDENSLTGAYCTAKGRMVSSFRIARTDQQHYFLRMRRQIVDNTQKVLGKYIVFSKAEQHNASDEYLVLGLSGPAAQSTINHAFGKTPKQQNEVLLLDGIICIQLDSEGQRYECWVPIEKLSKYWSSLSNNLTVADSNVWELQNIRLGHAEVTAQTVETFIPQMLNFQITGEVCFTKGCYTGQEIVARMQYRGKLKRQMYRIQIDSPPPSPGTELFRASGGQSIGNIVNAVGINNSSCEALAVITNDDAGSDQVVIGPESTPVKILSLPYAINSEDH